MARKRREPLLIRSAESLGRVIGQLQRQIADVTNSRKTTTRKAATRKTASRKTTRRKAR